MKTAEFARFRPQGFTRLGALGRKSVTGLGAAALVCLLTACGGGAEWNNRDISGLMPPLEFELYSETGAQVTADDFDGQAQLMFFGFTHCPDICPITLGVLAKALDQLGPEAEAVDVLFVGVDPERDQPEVLAEYTDAFGPRFVGLSGTQEQLKALAKRYRVSFSYEDRDATGAYGVNHSSAVYAFDETGKVRLLIDADTGPEAIAADLRRLIREG
ncbi:MAG: SCO family protein [Pseudomonadota bacterium]|nr:SCO family protein [Pseudomonadota bacterium]